MGGRVRRSGCAGVVRGGPGAGERGPNGVGSGLKLVATIPYLQGTHMEHTTIGGRDYLFTATQASGPADLRAIDVTNPEKPKVVSQMKCGSFQGHIQIAADNKTLILGVDGETVDGNCVKLPDEGFVTVDISDPRHMKPVGFMSIPVARTRPRRIRRSRSSTTRRKDRRCPIAPPAVCSRSIRSRTRRSRSS